MLPALKRHTHTVYVVYPGGMAICTPWMDMCMHVCAHTHRYLCIYTYFPIRSLKKNPEYFIEGNELHIQL